MILHDSIVQSGTGSAGWYFSSMWGLLLLLERLRASSLTHWDGSIGTAEQLGAGWASLSIHQSYGAGLFPHSMVVLEWWTQSLASFREEAEIASPSKGAGWTYHWVSPLPTKAFPMARPDSKGGETDSISWCEDWDTHVGHWDRLSCMWCKVQIVQMGTQCEVSFFWHHCPWHTRNSLLLCFLSILPEIVCT